MRACAEHLHGYSARAWHWATGDGLLSRPLPPTRVIRASYRIGWERLGHDSRR